MSQRVDEYPERNEKRDAIDQKFMEFVYTSGYQPISVPNSISLDKNISKRKQYLWKWIERIGIQGVILSGGNDLGEYPERDETESWLLDYAEKYELPSLGICRGMQMMGVRNGCELIKVENHVRIKHAITGDISGVVNSYHNSSIDSCPNDYVVLAKSDDGYIEAIKHKKLSWEGWMWHPEREDVFSKTDIRRFKKLMDSDK